MFWTPLPRIFVFWVAEIIACTTIPLNVTFWSCLYFWYSILYLFCYSILNNIFFRLCVCVYILAWSYMHVPAEVRSGYQVPWNCMMWVLGTRPWFYIRAASALNCWTMSWAPILHVTQTGPHGKECPGRFHIRPLGLAWALGTCSQWTWRRKLHSWALRKDESNSLCLSTF